MNLDALRQYLSFDYVPAPLSIYEGISKLPAAHTLTLEDGRYELRLTIDDETKEDWFIAFTVRHGAVPAA